MWDVGWALAHADISVRSTKSSMGYSPSYSSVALGPVNTNPTDVVYIKITAEQVGVERTMA
jgi:hypothetical protein